MYAVIKLYLGIKSLNLPEFDPYNYPNPVQFARDAGLVQVDGKISKNMIIKGLTNAKLNKFKGFDKHVLEIDVVAPEMIFQGLYQTKAKVLYVPFDYRGSFLIRMSEKNFNRWYFNELLNIFSLAILQSTFNLE